jgi:diguanylate cyclase (GGDEF)-like protein
MRTHKRHPLSLASAQKTNGGLLDFSALGWGRAIALTVTGTLVCILAALAVDTINWPTLTPEQVSRSILIDIFLPLILAGSMLAFVTAKLRELALARHELTILASTDGLTAVLNRGAFRLLVDSYLEHVGNVQSSSVGTLLVVDVDHFKQINDQFGHDQGDIALRNIAQTIVAAVRDIDLVGRIGGEEFGVFLPGTTEREAAVLAERIRMSVASTDFSPAGVKHPMSVSVGGVVCRMPTTFDRLFRAADLLLYQAKSAGRNRVDLDSLAVT